MVKRINYAFSLTQDKAYLVACGKIPVTICNEDYEDANHFIIHACSYEDPLDEKEGNQNLLKAGFPKDIVVNNSIIATAKANIFEYDDKRFKVDAMRHGKGSDLNIFRVQYEWGDEPVYGYEWQDIVMLPKPILNIAEDAEDGMVWETESPFEVMCFRLALNERLTISGQN
ncbi:MAG: hypothetical protein HWQ38_35980 [Nostoc sp. NMS7]|uniref:hypothetical protein n=1 Tax=Nostoc sp. NMS7 TaxID=2815391 RepID=UPI0025D8B640|nr:hypothetical protein [Nostoc sp. NMS7]MBN3951583.1 hypothetical protein [Nostoc sp. NMS7]